MKGHTRTIRVFFFLLLMFGFLCGSSSSSSSSSSQVDAESSSAATAPDTTASSSSNNNIKSPEHKHEHTVSTPVVERSSSLEPVVLTTVNFDKHMGDGSRWLVEFYAPWSVQSVSDKDKYIYLILVCFGSLGTVQLYCIRVYHVHLLLLIFSHCFPTIHYFRCGHCTSFAPTYSEIARHFHSKPELGVKVGKIDTTVEKALGQRFDLTAFPAFFLISGSNVYEFDSDRTKAGFIQFATKGYKQQAVRYVETF